MSDICKFSGHADDHCTKHDSPASRMVCIAYVRQEIILKDEMSKLMKKVNKFLDKFDKT